MKTTDPPDSACRIAAEWIRPSRSGVAFTGAGISTESGIPDFRSPEGVWSKYRQILFDEYVADPDARREYWEQKCEGHVAFAESRPNLGHQILGRWESQGRLRGVVTQNIDGLHEAAGSQSILNLHGTARKVGCLDCSFLQPADPFVAEFLKTHQVPDCPACGGILKHATISFGQPLPSDLLHEAASWSRNADVYLALGSSLVVTPAANMPRVAAEHGAKLIIINRDPTPLDSIADLVIHRSLGETLAEIDALLSD